MYMRVPLSRNRWETGGRIILMINFFPNFIVWKGRMMSQLLNLIGGFKVFISVCLRRSDLWKNFLRYYMLWLNIQILSFSIRKEIIIFKTIVWGCKRSGGEHPSLQNAPRSGSCWRYTSLWTWRRMYVSFIFKTVFFIIFRFSYE